MYPRVDRLVQRDSKTGTVSFAISRDGRTRPSHDLVASAYLFRFPENIGSDEVHIRLRDGQKPIQSTGLKAGKMTSGYTTKQRPNRASCVGKQGRDVQ